MKKNDLPKSNINIEQIKHQLGPCDHTCFDVNLQKRWLAINKRMKEVGVEEYFAESKDNSRY